MGKEIELQIFGTDLDAESIETARTGRYPAGIAADVPAEQLERYFIEEDGTYRICKHIREMLVFAPQNIIKDPPFTKINLLCCRNLLIYFNSDLQKKLLPLFHYGLKPEGVLVLGPSESIGAFTDFFVPLEKKWKIFQRREMTMNHALPEIPFLPSTGGSSTASTTEKAYSPKAPNLVNQIEKLLLSGFVPPTVVVNERGEIVYIHGRTGRYLEPAVGKPSNNIQDMAREGLQIELAAAIRKVTAGDTDSYRRQVRIKSNGEFSHADLFIMRIKDPTVLRGLLLVMFKPLPAPPPPRETSDDEAASSDQQGTGRAAELERELNYTKETLQSTVEELETSNEELKSTNEELQSTNEELQSSNEELETSKEEMQSLNEELTTVNAELQSKVDELSRANDDMQNLLNSTDIATIFLDRDLNIQRYTEEAKKIIKFIPADIGRSVEDLVTDINYDDMVADGREVLRTLECKEKHVSSNSGRWYLMRMVPYRTTENVIDGIVITFVDISRIKEAEDTASQGKKAKQLLQSVFDTFPVPALVLDEDLRVVKANAMFCRTFVTSRKETEQELIYEIGTGEWDIAKLRRMLENIIPEQTVIENFEVRGDFPIIGERSFYLNARMLEQENGMPGMVLLTMAERATI